jgi:hypothetical protein
MMSTLVPAWILCGPFLAILVLNSMFNSGTSAMSSRPASLGPDRDLDGRVPTGRVGVTEGRLHDRRLDQ